jgi:hypothetical protein
MPDERTPQPLPCPWCPYTGSFKQVLMHMESAHHQRWRDLALYAPISGGGSGVNGARPPCQCLASCGGATGR